MPEDSIKDIPLIAPFKASLNCFDCDQTYDLLACSKVTSEIYNLIRDNSIGDHFLPLSNDLSIYLIDRYTPDNHKWCDEWTIKTYPFLKTLSRTWLLNNNEINGRAYGFEPRYKATLPSELNLPDFPSEVQISVKKGKSVVITWLEFDCGSPQPSFVRNGGVYEWTKKSKTLRGREKEDFNITLVTANWLHNSVVITSFDEKDKETDEKCYTLRGLNELQIPLLMYENLEQTWNNIINQLIITTCEVLSGVTATVKTTCNGPNISREEINFSTPLFQQVPSDYYYASLICANNNYWKDGTTGKADIGKKLTVYHDKEQKFLFLKQLDTYGFFDKWREGIKETNPIGYEIHDSTIENPSDKYFLPQTTDWEFWTNSQAELSVTGSGLGKTITAIPSPNYVGGIIIFYRGRYRVSSGDIGEITSNVLFKEVLITKENKGIPVTFTLPSLSINTSNSVKVINIEKDFVGISAKTSLFTAKNNQPINIPWYGYRYASYGREQLFDLSFVDSSYPSLDEAKGNYPINTNTPRQAFKFRFKAGVQWEQPQKTISDVWTQEEFVIRHYHIEAEYLAWQQYVRSQQVMGLPYDGFYSVSESSISGVETQYINQYRREGIVIHFLGNSDLNLFSDWQVAIIKNGIAYRGITVYETVEREGGGTPRLRSAEVATIASKVAVKINVNASNIQAITFNHNILETELPSSGTEVITQGIDLRRSLRVGEVITLPDIIQTELVNGKPQRTAMPEDAFKLVLEAFQKKELTDYYELVYLADEKWKDINPIQLEARKCYVIKSNKTLILPSGLSENNKVAIAVLPCYDKDGNHLPDFTVNVTSKGMIESKIGNRSYENIIEYDRN